MVIMLLIKRTTTHILFHRTQCSFFFNYRWNLLACAQYMNPLIVRYKSALKSEAQTLIEQPLFYLSQAVSFRVPGVFNPSLWDPIGR